MPRTIAIGDVHGCVTALTTLLDLIKPAMEDTIIFLGDVVDRGPASKDCVDRILALANECLVISILGNHEELMRAVIERAMFPQVWHEVGGAETLESYGGSYENIPREHLRWLAHLRPFYETATEIFVHANLEPKMTLANQSRDWLRWKPVSAGQRPHISGKRVICGHTEQQDGWPLVFPGWVCIDTAAYRLKWLTGLDVTTNHIWQANEAGQSREMELAPEN
jgi:serine/threonine protein phosphatase 1